MSLPAWNARAPEEANHFNPAYCGALIYEFVRAFEKEAPTSPDYALIFCALPVAMHAPTRDSLPRTTLTGLLPWLERTPAARIGFAARARGLAPYLREAIQFALARNALVVDEAGRVALGSKRASFTPKALDDMTTDIRNTVTATRMVGRWFAASGDTSTILAAWGVRV
ncbi:three component ABC system middle component [Hyphomonas atlantica corrig.]|uniref:three component ABC system middle component n=1 Tax=Hyphomonas atlantica TaxID=1280948 RepID=UPI0023520640|nr:three component ABC system middle component [Hyphomonas atlantica]